MFLTAEKGRSMGCLSLSPLKRTRLGKIEVDVDKGKIEVTAS